MKVNAQGLKGAIASVSTDINRPGLQCLLLTDRGIVATNGRTMVIVPWEDGAELPAGTRVLVHPPKPVPKDRDGICNVVTGANGATFFGGKASVECEAVDEFFPKYRECIPVDVSPVVQLDASLLRNALLAFGDAPVTLSLGREASKPATLTANGIVAVIMPMAPGMQCKPERRWDVLAEVLSGNGDITSCATACGLPASDVVACMRLLEREGHVVGGPDKYTPAPLPEGLSGNAQRVFAVVGLPGEPPTMLANKPCGLSVPDTDAAIKELLALGLIDHAHPKGWVRASMRPAAARNFTPWTREASPVAVVAPAPVAASPKRGPLPKPDDRAQRRKDAYALCRERQQKYLKSGSAEDLAAWDLAKRLFASA